MASRKLVRDLFLSNSKRFFYSHLLTSQKVSTSNARLRLLQANGYSGHRQFSVFNEFSRKVKGEANKNQEFQQSVKELKEKAEELKGVKEDLKVRTKQTTEQLYKQVDGVWTEAEATAKKVSANLKEKISAATEEVKGTFGVGKQDSEFTSTSAEKQDSGFTSTSEENGTDAKTGSKTTSGDETQQKSGTNDTAYKIFAKFTSSVSSVSPKVSMAFQKLKEAKPIDWAKAGYDVVKDELSGNPSKRKHIEYGASSSTSSSTGERSTRTDVAIVASKQSRWGKKWEAFKEKMQGHPVFKRISGLSEPVVVKSQEFAEDIRDRWETTDNPVVHKIQDLSESVFGETATAVSFKEIRRRDPSFSLPDFVAEVQEVVKPVLNAYFKGNVEVLKKYCSNEVIERCKAEHRAYESQGIYFDNKILHISDVEVRETKMMGDTPIIIVAFQTQQVYCVRDRLGSITEGGKDTIHTVYYAWAMQQVDVEELGEGALFPIWRLREMQQLGVKTLI
ncbi:Mitochondrial import inner membrane translocase subunit TIM44-2 like [Actinidia chinensis var. chinensis]|uniref:Mitochondrial import inner membrane translocase subunit TIM44-2 like n=1 Tax=Actinidia chinensis var. chinensis TaxID=1590841 RepID=A0A2R6PP73_ACTCC|nr:Mitochondrial import inner membrane translocase subunit TIM44-2 like [Actinidia chinensis var. chinensis]